MILSFVVKAKDSNKRLDTFLCSETTDIPRSQITKAIKAGKITVDNLIVKPGYALKLGQNIKVSIDDNSERQDIKIPIIYEDDQVIVINKPEGVLVHSKGEYNNEFTVADFIADKVQDISGNRAGIVHRLDRGTSGVMIVAKNKDSLNWLQKQFAKRSVKKSYIAVISGEIEPSEAVIQLPIERDPKKPKQFRIGKNGKFAESHYRTLKKGDKYSLLEISPKTGRTHQIRVHLAYMKHPIVGDTFYDGEPFRRLLLHASSLELTLPNKQRRIFKADTPAGFHDIIE